MNLHSSLSSELGTAAEVVECIELSSDLTAVECERRLVTYLRIVRMEGCEHICVLRAHCRDIRDQVCGRKRVGRDLLSHPLETTACKGHAKASAVVTELHELRVSSLWSICNKLLAEVHILSLNEETVIVEVETA